MGIDIYLEWDGKGEEDEQKQAEAALTMTAGNVGYLREAYHGGPYATKILVREAFESDDNTARIPAAVMRERLTGLTEPAYCASGGHETAAKIVDMFREAGLMAENQVVLSGLTQPMSVEEAVRTRMHTVYADMDESMVEEVVQSFREFVALAERKERETNKPCTVIASY